MSYNCIDRTLSQLFSSIGRFIGRHPLYFIILPIILSVALATGLLRLKFQNGLEYLYAPINGRTLEDKQIASEYFPMNVSTDFDLGRMTRTGKFNPVIVTAKDGGNVLNKSIMAEVVMMDTLIRNVIIEADGMNWTYADLCAKKKENCVENKAKELAESIDLILDGKLQMEYPIFIEPTTFKYTFYALIFGGVELDDENYIETAKAIRFMYYLDDSTPEHYDRATMWESAVAKLLESYDFEYISVSWFSITSYNTEMKKVSRLTIRYLTVILILVIILNFLLLLNKQWTQGKPWLSVAVLICALLAVASSWGLGLYCGMEFISMLVFNVFLVIGIGMHDNFVLISAWRRTNLKDEVERRLSDLYSEVFVPITMTFLIMLICFCIGLIIPFRAARIFSSYSAICSVFLFLYEVTFLGACIAIDGYREKRNLHSLIYMRVDTYNNRDREQCCRYFCTEAGEAVKPQIDFWISKYFQEKYVHFISQPVNKTIVMLLYITYLGVSIWQSTKLDITSGLTDVFVKNSYIVTYYKNHYEYFTNYPHRVQIIIDSKLDYSNVTVQNKVEDILQKFENSTYGSGDSTSCWLRSYLKAVQSEKLKWVWSNHDLYLKTEFIDALAFIFLRFEAAKVFVSDIIFNEDNTEIETIRCSFQSHNVHNTNDEKNMLEDFYRIADESDIPVKFTSMLFRMYELSTIIKSLVLWTLPITAGIVLAVTVLLIPNLTNTLICTLLTLSIQVGVLGYLTLWNVRVNAFYLIMFVMFTGIAVNYICHLAYAYVTSMENTSRRRMTFALKSRAAAMIQNCLIMIIVCTLLLLVRNQVSLVFYKMLFLVFLFSGLHALFVLPVLYLIISDIRCFRKEETVEICQMDKITDNAVKT